MLERLVETPSTHRLRKMEAMKKFPYLPEMPMADTLLEFAARVGDSFRSDSLQEVSTGIPAKKHILLLDSSPGSGKTYSYRNFLAPYLQDVIRHMRRQGIDASMEYLHWDKLEKILIKRGLITPEDPQKPFKTEELRIISDYFEEICAYKVQGQESTPSGRITPILREMDLLQNKPHSILVVEKPGVTAVKHEETWMKSSRQYAPELADKLVHGKDHFSGITRRHIHLSVLSAAGGPSMDYYTHVRSTIGKEGATADQLIEIRAASWSAVSYLVSQGDFPVEGILPDYAIDTIMKPSVLLGKSGMPVENVDNKYKRETELTARATRLDPTVVFSRSCYRLGEPLVTLNNYLQRVPGKDKKIILPDELLADELFIFYNRPRIPRRALLFSAF